jgi:hypothetical protein
MKLPYVLPHVSFGGVLYVAYPSFERGTGFAGWYEIAAYYGNNPIAYAPEFFDDRAKKVFIEANGGEYLNGKWMPGRGSEGRTV